MRSIYRLTWLEPKERDLLCSVRGEGMPVLVTGSRLVIRPLDWGQ